MSKILNHCDVELFQPVVFKKASDSIYESLLNKILKGDYKPGDRIPSERDLMEQYKRGLSSVREAIERLKSEGYVEVIQGSGVEVMELDNSQLAKPFEESLKYLNIKAEGLLEFVRAASPIVVGLASERRTEEELNRLEAVIDSMENCSREDAPTAVKEAVQKAHIIIAEMSHNRMIAILWSCLIEFFDLESYATDVREREKTGAKFAAMHRKIFEAIKDGDPEIARVRSDEFYEEFSTFITDNVRLTIKEDSDKIPYTRTYEPIYDQIKDLIYTGQLKPGDKLPAERIIAERVGKNRAAVRDALILLEQKGLVKKTHGSGSVVQKFSTDEMQRILKSMMDTDKMSVDDVLEVRRISEVIGSEWAAARRTYQELEEIRAAIRYWSPRKSRAKLIEMGINFTNAICKASHNDVVYVINRMTSECLHNRHAMTESDDYTEEHAIIDSQHRQILREIEMGNGKGVREATMNHLNTVKKYML